MAFVALGAMDFMAFVDFVALVAFMTFMAFVDFMASVAFVDFMSFSDSDLERRRPRA